jgi:hypothetical protein
MATLEYDCPHCRAQKVSSSIVWHYTVPEQIIVARQLVPYGYASVICGVCIKPVTFKITMPSAGASYHKFKEAFAAAQNTAHTLLRGDFRADVVTTETEIEGPEHLTDNVAKAFRAAEKNYPMEDCEDASATMYRRSLDVATKEAYPSISGSLSQRIAELSRQNVIPQAMKDWADHIRWIGNDGAHEPIGVNKDELEVIRGFTDAFLRYLISMPFKVRLARGEINPDGTARTS